MTRHLWIIVVTIRAVNLKNSANEQSKTLWIVLGINGVMFCLELIVGLLAGSVALQADSLDMLSDTLVYGFSLYAIAKSDRWRAGAALLKGSVMAIFGIGVLFQSVYKFLAGGIPESHFMFIMSALALIANASCLYFYCPNTKQMILTCVQRGYVPAMILSQTQVFS